MGSKNVVLRDEAYEFLKGEKRPGETFSDVVLRLRGAAAPLTSFAGAWKDMPRKDLARIRSAIRTGRELDRRRMDQLLGGDKP
jgi:predicted CopG family antitoxin